MRCTSRAARPLPRGTVDRRHEALQAVRGAYDARAMSIESEAPSPATQSFAIGRASRYLYLGILVFFSAMVAFMLVFLFLLIAPSRGELSGSTWGHLLLIVLFLVWGEVFLTRKLLPLTRRGHQLWLHADGHFEHVTPSGRRVREHVSDFQGFRVVLHNGESSGLRLTRKSGQPLLGLPIVHMEKVPTIHEWFERHMINLDQVDLEQERALIVAQHTSDQEDPATALPRLERYSRWGIIWLSVALFAGMMMSLAPRAYFGAWLSLSADVTLGLLLLIAWEMARHRRLVMIAQKQVHFRPSITALLGPLLVACLMGLSFSPIEDLPRTLTWGVALLLALGLASLPAAPDVTRRQRAAFGLSVFVLSLPIVNTLIVGLSPSPAHEFHTAKVTSIEPLAGNWSSLRWSFDQPVGVVAQGHLVRMLRRHTVGDPIEVDLARGALGLHWVAGVRPLSEPVPDPMKTDSRCQ